MREGERGGGGVREKVGYRRGATCLEICKKMAAKSKTKKKRPVLEEVIVDVYPWVPPLDVEVEGEGD